MVILLIFFDYLEALSASNQITFSLSILKLFALFLAFVPSV